MVEYAVFSDEGCLERQFSRFEDAEKVAAHFREFGGMEDAYAAEMCPDHEEQPREGCDECDVEDDEEDEDDEDD